MEMQSPLSEEKIKEFTSELGLTKEEIIEFNAEFKAYDTDGDGTITTEDLGVVNKVMNWLMYISVMTVVEFHGESHEIY